MNRNLLSVSGWCVVASLLFSCDEQLPPRGDPANLLSATVQAVYLGAPDPVGKITTRNVYRIYVTTKNHYDETLQGYGVFGGSIEIVWERNPQYRKTVNLDHSIVVDNRRYKYDPYLNVITMDPRDEVSFYVEWDWTTDSHDTLTNLFPLVRDEDCPVYRVNNKGHIIGFERPRWSSKEIFVINGNVKLFREFAASQLPQTRQEIEYETYRKDMCQRFTGAPGR